MSLVHRAAAAAALLIAPACLAAPVAYTLGDGGQSLVRIADLDRPDVLSAVVLTTPEGRGVALSAIAHRPVTGGLYGYAHANATVYTVDPATGRATPLVMIAPGTAAPEAGFDFNNRIDAARIVGVAGDNLVFDPKADPPTLKRFTPLFYAEGDVHAGRTPRVYANAYTNAVPQAPETVQYVIDAATGSLATLANNEGRLATVGRLMVDGQPLALEAFGDMDIVSARVGDNRAFALLTTAAGQALYAVPLAADAAGHVVLRRLGTPGTARGALTGLAVFEPAGAPVSQ